MRKIFNRHKLFFLIFIPLFAALLYPLFSMKTGFSKGDYDLQFYPWTSVYADSLKQGVLSLWTSLVQSGFYMFAEGQVGMLYALNIFFFRFFEFNTAWNSLFLLHFLMGGIFMNAYLRKMGVTASGAVLGAVLFVFGSPYAGCFYNIVTMRTLVWFPLMLFFCERILRNECRISLWLLAVVIGQSWLGGFAQTAAYAAGMTFIYYLLRAAADGDRRYKLHILFLISLILGTLTALPQIWATLELAASSTRTLQTKEFALWGSFAPWSALTMLCYPWRGFLSTGMYLGVFPLLLLLVSPLWRLNKVCFWMLLFSIFLALGRFNPLYHVLLNFPVASMLRNPSKFLFFTSFFLIVLFTFAWDYLFSRMSSDSVHIRRKCRSVTVVSGICFAVIYGVYLTARFGQGLLLSYGNWYADTFVIGKSFHRYSVEFYREKVQNFLHTIQNVVNPGDWFFWLPQIFIIAVMIGFVMLRSQKIRIRHLKVCLIFLIVLDLYIYGASGFGTGFLGNVGEFRSGQELAGYPSDGKWMDLRAEKNAELPPNRNVLYRYPTVGGYTPILDLRYFELLGWTGQLDDSVGLPDVKHKDFTTHQNILDFAGARYLISGERGLMEPFSVPHLNPVSGNTFYENPGVYPEFTWVSSARTIREHDKRVAYLLSNEFDPSAEVVLEDTGEREMPSGKKGDAALSVQSKADGSVTVQGYAPGPGYLVRSSTYNAGWKASKDGKSQKIYRANHAFQAVYTEEGPFIINFHFKPDSFILGRWFALGAFLFILTLITVAISRRLRS